jgi:pyruvate carboxylase
MATATDVYDHEMPGGQVTNLRFQAEAVGLGDKWDDVKKTYAIANIALGDIVKVTPSSKVVGDLALFMVQNDLDGESVVEQAEKLDFPDSVISFMNGRIGVPSGGFPEPFRTRVLKGKKPEIPDGRRPGEMLPSLDFQKEQTTLTERYARPFIKQDDFPPEDKEITDYLSHNDILSNALYPDVHRDFVNHLGKYGDTSALPTPQFFSGMQEGEEINFIAKNGREQHIKLVAIGQIHEDGTRRVFFEVNGLQNSFDVLDRTSDVAANLKRKETADPEDEGSVGSAMKGLVVDVLKSAGDLVEEGEPLAVMSAMKMETIISAPKKGRIERFAVKTGDDLDSGDLIAVIR